MTTSDEIALFSSITSVISVLIGLAAAVAAWRSAGSAAESSRSALDQWRVAAKREVNSCAHKLSANSERVKQLAESVPRARAQLLVMNGQSPRQSSHHDSPESHAHERVKRVNEMQQHALGLIASNLDEKSETELAETQRKLDGQLAQLEVLKEAVVGELEGIDSQVRFARDQNALRLMSASVRSCGMPTGI